MKQTKEIYLKGEDIQDLHRTVSDMLDRLTTETKKNGTEENYTQMVVQLNPNMTGKEWKMFVYYNHTNDTFTYSYQDQDCFDSDFYRSVTREFMLAKVLEEAKAVSGIQWIGLDY